MATVLFMVKATIPRDQDAAFNRWYNEEHCPQMQRYPGVVSARRFKTLAGDDRYQYVALYEMKDEATYERFLKSPEFVDLKKEYDTHFPASERVRVAYTQIWP